MPLGGEWIPVLDEMQPNASLQTDGYSDHLIRVARAPKVEGSPQLIDRDLGHQDAQHTGPEEQQHEPQAGSNQWSVGEERAMGDEASVGPPDELQRPPTPEGPAAGIEIGGEPQPTEAEASSSDHSRRPVQQQSSAETDGQA